jgi:hypothetical protein
MVEDPDLVPLDAVIVALPFVTAVTRPVADTDATPAAEVAQVTTGLGTGFPLASTALAASCTVSPSAASVLDGGATVTAATSWVTWIDAVPLLVPEVAVIVADPFAFAVTAPRGDTDATARLELCQVNAAPVTGWLFPSVAWAVSETVAPRDRRVAAGGVTATALTTWLTLTVAKPAAEPTDAEIWAEPFATAVTSPAPVTDATVPAELCQLSTNPGMIVPVASRTTPVS